MTLIQLFTTLLALALGVILGYSLGYTDAEQESFGREPEMGLDGHRRLDATAVNGSPLIDRGRGEHW